MSEYQYYEFQAVDLPLTSKQMAELRALSTRANITATRFQNVYHYGDFKGDPLAVMEQYFDAFIYVANWGTHQLMLRLPTGLLDSQVARSYADDEWLSVHDRGKVVILEFLSRDDEGGGWIDDEESASWMPRLLPLRAELAGGDLRALYLGWLARVEAGMLDDEEIEPPVPAGLGRPSAALKALAEFSRVSDELLAAAAACSPDLRDEPSPGDIERWIENLPISDKDTLLNRLATGSDAHLRAEINRRVRDANAPQPNTPAAGRTVAELLAAAAERADVRLREETERNVVAQARREREQAAARTTFLDSLVGREEALWREADALIETKRPKEYDQAVQHLIDLRDLSVRQESAEAFVARLDALRGRYAKRPSLLERLDRAGLTG